MKTPKTFAVRYWSFVVLFCKKTLKFETFGQYRIVFIVSIEKAEMFSETLSKNKIIHDYIIKEFNEKFRIEKQNWSKKNWKVICINRNVVFSDSYKKKTKSFGFKYFFLIIFVEKAEETVMIFPVHQTHFLRNN